MNRKRKIIFSLLTVIFLLIITLVVVTFSKKDDKHVEEKTTTTKEMGNWVTPSGEASLIKIYMVKDAGVIVTAKEGGNDPYAGSSNHKLINSYRCYLNGCESYGANNENNYIIIKDDGYVIYDYEKNLMKSIKLPNANYNSVEFLTYEGKDYGLSVSSINEKYAFYDLKKERFTTDFKYTNIFTADTACLSRGYFIASIDDGDESKFYVVDYNDDKTIKESNVFMGSVGNGNHVYYYENYTQINGYDVAFYNDEFKPLFEGKTHSAFGVSKTGNLVVKNDDASFGVYTKNGVLVKTSKPYKDIFMILNDYVVVLDNDNFLKIVDYDGNVAAKFVKLSDQVIIDLISSGERKIDGDDGVYLTVVNLSENTTTAYYYNFKSKRSGEVKTDD